MILRDGVLCRVWQVEAVTDVCRVFDSYLCQRLYIIPCVGRHALWSFIPNGYFGAVTRLLAGPGAAICQQEGPCGKECLGAV